MNSEILSLDKKYSNQKSKTVEVFGEEVGFLTSLFGCWHFRISRPMTIAKETYCVCINCGARIKFDKEKLTTVGKYYYPTQNSLYSDK